MAGLEHDSERDDAMGLGPEERVNNFAVVARSALADAGLPCTDEDIELLAMVAQVLGPGLAALNEVDLRLLAPEHDLDPSRAPR
jgi:hypothetical protein